MLHRHNCDICIVGTGASGGILAYRLTKAGFKVLSLEAGDTISNDYFTERNREYGNQFRINAEVLGNQYTLYNFEANNLIADENISS